MKIIKKIIIILLKQLDIGSAIAVRLTKLTGKSKVPIHPKHLLTERLWFTRYLKNKDIVLDLGCGNGQTSLKTAKIARKVFGVDIDKRLLRIAKIQANHQRVKNIEFSSADLEKSLKFKDSYFDKVFLFDVLEHLANRDQIMREVKRILKPRGLLFLGVPNSTTSWKKLQRSVGVCSFSDPDHKIEFSQKQITELVQKQRFKILTFNYAPLDTPLRGVFDVVGGISLSLYRSLSNWRKEKVIGKPQEAVGFEIVAQNIK